MQPLAWLRVLLAILAPLSGISPCVMPVLPPHTIGQSSAALFDAEGTVLNNMASVAIQCVAGYIQEEPTDANGISYEYVCPPQLATGEEDTENFRIPNPSCVPCPIGTYSSVIGLTADCTPCPAHSTTRTAGESRAYHGNMTNVRFCCYRDSTCSPSSGATAIDKCLCEEGHTGLVVNAASECKPCNPHTHKSGLGSRACRFTEQYSPTCQACIVDECKDTVAMMEECSSDLSEGAMNNISAALASCFTTFELQEAHLVSVTDNARCSSTCQTMLDCRHDCLTSSACKEDRALYTEDGVVRCTRCFAEDAFKCKDPSRFRNIMAIFWQVVFIINASICSICGFLIYKARQGGIVFHDKHDGRELQKSLSRDLPGSDTFEMEMTPHEKAMTRHRSKE